MTSIEVSNDSPASHYDILFKKSSHKVEWDEKSPERSSVPSLPPDDIGQLLCYQEECKTESEHTVTESSCHFIPTTVRFEPRSTTFEVASPSVSDFIDSLEDSNEKTLESGESEELTETEEDSVEDDQITEDELEIQENWEKEDGDPVGYLDKEVFPVLLPCLEKMLFAAKNNNVLKVQKSRFNGLDYLAELLWNCNPLHPERQGNYVPLFEIPFVQKHLEEHPRPIIPQSWLWSRPQAAIRIQAAIRGYLVRCQPQVQEMRQFWKTLAEEKELAKERALDEEKDLEKDSIQIESKLHGQKSTTLDNRSYSSIYSFYSQYLDGKS